MMNLLRQAWHHSVTDGARRSSAEENTAIASDTTTKAATTGNKNTNNMTFNTTKYIKNFVFCVCLSRRLTE